MDNIVICNAVFDWLDCDSDCMGVWDWLMPSSPWALLFQAVLCFIFMITTNNTSNTYKLQSTYIVAQFLTPVKTRAPDWLYVPIIKLL